MFHSGAIVGLGAAGLFQGALGMIGNIVILEKRSMHTGIMISICRTSVCIRPVLGGAFTDRVSWMW